MAIAPVITIQSRTNGYRGGMAHVLLVGGHELIILELRNHYPTMLEKAATFIHSLLPEGYLDYSSVTPVRLSIYAHAPEDKLMDENLSPVELFFAFVAASYRNRYTEAKALATLARGHVAMFERDKVQDLIDFKRLLDPPRALVAKEHYDFVASLNSSTLIARSQDKDFVAFGAKLFNIVNQPANSLTDDVLIGDWTYRPTGPVKQHAYGDPAFFRLPVNTAKYRKYLEGVKAKDLLRLIEGIPANTAAGAAIAMSEEILAKSEVDKDELLLKANEAFQSMFKKSYTTTDPSYYGSVYPAFMNSCDKENTMAVIKEYFEGEEVVNGKMLPLMVTPFFEWQARSWVRNTDHADYVVGKLREALTPREVMLTVRDVATLNVPLTVTQWESYIKQLDLYRGAPAEWWVPMISRSC